MLASSTGVRPHRVALLAPIVLAASLFPGCGPETVAEPSSPVVSPDSEAGQRARAEDERIARENQEREARARKRFRSLPDEG